MTTLTVNAPNGINGAGFSFDALAQLDFDSPRVASLTSTAGHIDFDGVSIDLTGSGLGVGLFGITGVVTGLVLSQNGAAIATITGTSLSAATTYSQIANGDFTGLANSLFAGNDSQTGSQKGDILSGLAGNDTLSGLAGADTLAGGVGDDVLRGGVGADRLVGGAGIDTATYSESPFGVTVDITAGKGTSGYAYGDVLSGIENVRGSSANDVLSGGATANTLLGNAGNDVIDGRGGKDSLGGGTGTDRFVFDAVSHSTVGAPDRIVDFSHAEGDRIDLRPIDAATGAGGNQAFSFIGTAAFGHHAGELHYAITGGTTTISGDINGDAKADFSIVLTGAIHLVASDFLL
ncbi:calcium-binding protein [Inquilinus sp. NPDC058860]|uniref:calcium-binding protein n=1 Tax=Inquilinus sp. NPDC058860 TaxID=3346652 RepID=UPI0036814C36